MALLRLQTLIIAFALMPLAAFSESQQHGHHSSPYAGFEKREIKSLSDQDIMELRSGGGWGLALPAELNGRPGPKHLLELRDELGLSASQVDLIAASYDDMRKSAVLAGERFIAAEAALSQAFTNFDLSESELQVLLAEAATARADLRFVHLSEHLATSKILSDAQIEKYSVLRGYADDPCAKVPDGHDPKMWRLHNGC